MKVNSKANYSDSEVVESLKAVVGKSYTTHTKDLVRVESITNGMVKLTNFTHGGSSYIEEKRLILVKEVKKNGPKPVTSELKYRGPKW